MRIVKASLDYSMFNKFCFLYFFISFFASAKKEPRSPEINYTLISGSSLIEL